MTMSIIALLGRKDEPTDAVEEYCRYLGDALRLHDFQLEIRRVPWQIHGWPKALRALRLQAARWRYAWVLVQYTALAWSARAFPLKLLRVLKTLKSAGARVGLVFHDVEPYSGMRLVDFLRRFIQVRTMRRALSLADLAIFTVPTEKLSWLNVVPPHASFIPVGPNLPIPPAFQERPGQGNVPTIGVFSISGGKAGARETQTILAAVHHAAQGLGKLRLSVFGRHSELREPELRRGLADLPVEISVEGVLPGQQIVERLSRCDVLLFVRGAISSRRGSAVAAIACELPIIASPGSETSRLIEDAGVVLVSADQPDQLNAALVRVLSDRKYRQELAGRNRAAYHSHFSWPSIAACLATVLKKQP